MTQRAAAILLRAKALNGVGALAMFQTDYEAAKVFLTEGLTLYRRLGNEEGVASCLTYLGYTGALGFRDDIPVVDLLEEALEIKPRLEDPRTVAHLLVLAGIVAGVLREDWDESAALHEEALEVFREIRDTQGIGICLYNLGLIETIRGELVRAKALLQDLMRLGRELYSKLDALHAFFGLAAVASSEGQTTHAVRLWGVVETMQNTDDTRITPSAYAAVDYEGRVAAARSQLGDATFEETWAEGNCMTQEEAIEYALEEGEPLSRPDSVSETPPASLTHREEEVASLVSRGLTNRRIAQELSLSERTVDTHMGRIFKKLELSSREEVAGRMGGWRPRGEGGSAVTGL